MEKFPNSEIYVSDSDYGIPSKQWLLGPFYDNFYKWLWAMGIDKWKPHGDCDNFASLYYAFCQVCHNVTWRRRIDEDNAAQGLAVGEMFYITDTRGGHAINVAITGKSPACEVITIEPQTGKVVELSKAECESCWFIRV